jgi:hypothetical protein
VQQRRVQSAAIARRPARRASSVPLITTLARRVCGGYSGLGALVELAVGEGS